MKKLLIAAILVAPWSILAYPTIYKYANPYVQKILMPGEYDCLPSVEEILEAAERARIKNRQKLEEVKKQIVKDGVSDQAKMKLALKVWNEPFPNVYDELTESQRECMKKLEGRVKSNPLFGEEDKASYIQFGDWAMCRLQQEPLKVESPAAQEDTK